MELSTLITVIAGTEVGAEQSGITKGEVELAIAAEQQFFGVVTVDIQIERASPFLTIGLAFDQDVAARAAGTKVSCSFRCKFVARGSLCQLPLSAINT